MSPKLRTSTRSDDQAALYDHYLVALTDLGASRYGMSRDEAETLAHDVLIASLNDASRAGDLEGWLTGAMMSAAQKRTARAPRR